MENSSALIKTANSNSENHKLETLSLLVAASLWWSKVFYKVQIPNPIFRNAWKLFFHRLPSDNTIFFFSELTSELKSQLGNSSVRQKVCVCRVANELLGSFARPSREYPREQFSDPSCFWSSLTIYLSAFPHLYASMLTMPSFIVPSKPMRM